MNRRTFLRTSGGVSIACLTPLGCKTADEARAAAGGSVNYEVGDEHLVFDEDSVEFELDPHGHQILDLHPSGETVSRVGELGQDAGEFNFPHAAVTGPDGRLYVADLGNSRIQVLASTGEHLTEIGSHGDGDGQLNHPRDLAIGPDGNLYVADTGNHRVQVFDLEGNFVRSIGQFDPDGRDGLNSPRAVAVTSNGDVHVADAGSVRVQVYTSDGAHADSYGGFGEKKGQLLSLSSIVADRADRIFIADPVGGFIHEFRSDGKFLGRFRPTDDDGEDAVPVRLQRTPSGMYVWTKGYEAAPR